MATVLTTPPPPPSIVSVRLGRRNPLAERAARLLPDPALLRKGQLRSRVEEAQALHARAQRAEERIGVLLPQRVGAHTADEEARDAAILGGSEPPEEEQLPRLDAELDDLARQVRVVTDALAKVITDIDALCRTEGAEAVAATAKRLDDATARLVELEREAQAGRDERDRLAAVVAWAASRRPDEVAGGLPEGVVSDPAAA